MTQCAAGSMAILSLRLQGGETELSFFLHKCMILFLLSFSTKLLSIFVSVTHFVSFYYSAKYYLRFI